jgi:Trypsin-like peptidase domain
MTQNRRMTQVARDGRQSKQRTITRFAGFAVLLITTLSSGGCASARKERLKPAETMVLATYPLASNKAFGTGFLMAMKDTSAPGGLVPVMVTSTHLVKTAGRGGAIYMPLRGFDSKGSLSVTLLEVVPAKNGKPFYVRHPRLDVAAFKVRFPEYFPTPLLLTLLEDKNLESNEPRVGEEVNFVGFPEGQGTSLGMFPVLRAGKIASFDQSLVGIRSFLINGDVYPGDSGAPVFRSSQTGKPSVVGMVIERLGFRGQSPFPLALAVDAKAIRETLRLLANRDGH